MDFLARLRNRPDSEHQQALARIVIALVGILYSSYIYFRDHEITVFYSTWFIVAYLVFAISIFVIILLNPAASPPRRIVGMVSDLSATGIVMHLLGEPAKVFLFVYLWIMVGNGLRYGRKYLQAAMVMGIVSFLGMAVSTPYWRNDLYLVTGYLGCMIILPLFFSSLLKKLNSSYTELEDLANKLRKMASHDSLTGLLNRHSFLEALTHEVAVAEREKKKLAVLFIDLDGFKVINDAHGHHSGDVVLKTVAVRLLAHVRKSDIVARYAGDEFVIFLSNTNAPEAARVAHKLIADICSPIQVAESPVSVSASIGIAIYPASGATANEILVKADMAMYRCKQQGKNGVLVDGHADMEVARLTEPSPISMKN